MVGRRNESLRQVSESIIFLFAQSGLAMLVLTADLQRVYVPVYLENPQNR